MKEILGIKDEKLGEFINIISLKEHEKVHYFTGFANDVTNPYFRQSKELGIYHLGELYEDTGIITADVPNRINCVDDFVDRDRQNLAIITQTLNFLPNGYFKMPKEFQERVENEVMECAKNYVQNYMSDEFVSQVKKELENDRN